jgi:YD repeat-containing protein
MMQQFNNLTIEQFNQSHTYDALNRPLTQTMPDNTVIEHTYNEAGLLETVKKDAQTYVSNINYNEKGQRTAFYYGNGSKTKYEYDPNTFRLTRLLTTRNAGADFLQDLNYTYDPVGNIVEVVDNAQQIHFISNSVIEPKGMWPQRENVQ